MKFVPVKITQSLGRMTLNTKKNSPSIMFAAGLAGVVGGTVLACRATLKVEPVLDKFKEDLDAVRGKNDESLEYEGSEVNPKDLVYVYAMNSYDLVRLYSPAIIVGGLGIVALTKSHSTLMNRNASLTAAYAVATEAFDAYRERVRKELGEEKEEDLYFGRTMEKPSKKKDSDDPQTDVYSVDENGLSAYARFFDESCDAYQKNAELNKLFIQCQQNYLNNRLHARGHVFLNEAYDQLGMSRTSAGAVVGWVSNGSGDNYIDFHMFDVRNAAFLASDERVALLDFNVDGVIYDQIGGR